MYSFRRISTPYPFKKKFIFMPTQFYSNLFNQSCGCIHFIPSSSLLLYLLLFPNFLPIILFICLLSSYRILTSLFVNHPSPNHVFSTLHIAPSHGILEYWNSELQLTIPVFLYLRDRMIRIPLYDCTMHSVSICNYNWRRKGNVTTVISKHECCTMVDANLIYSILNIFNSCLLTPAYLLSCSLFVHIPLKKNLRNLPCILANAIIYSPIKKCFSFMYAADSF